MSPSKNANVLGNSLVWAEIDLGALKRNLRVIRAKAGSAEVLAVVKADAYGHGMRAVARKLSGEGVRFFGVANIDEAIELRRVCPRSRILVLGAFCAAHAGLYVRHHVTPTLSSIEDAIVCARALGRSARFPVHVKIDTGMGRLGVWHEKALELFKAIRSLKNLHVEGVYTHFSSADAPDRSVTHRQIAVFETLLERLKKSKISPRVIHAANSMGLLRFRRGHYCLVRPGIVLYGLSSSGSHTLPHGMKPVLSLKTRITFLKEVKAGRTLSYGGTYRVKRRTRIATLPVGYSHGYRIAFSNRAQVLVRGRYCPVVGRVTMDQTLVDVGGVPGVKRWDVVTLIGREGRKEVGAAHLAALAGTIPYEIVCSIHSRIPRIYR